MKKHRSWTTVPTTVDVLTTVTDEEIDRLGEQFRKENIREKYAIPFSRYVELKKLKEWEQFIRYRNSKKVVATILDPKHVRELQDHSDPEIRDLAGQWLLKADEVRDRINSRLNILESTSALLTLDSWLHGLLLLEDKGDSEKWERYKGKEG